MMRRVPEVLDCWFESGSMPFAQVHYPFENKEWFDNHAPADFIVEYIAQTRGWFYTLHVLSAALFDRPAFRNVICHGVVLDARGPQAVEEAAQLPRPRGGVRDHRLRRAALVPDGVADPARRRPAHRHRRRSDISEVVRLVLNPIWNAYPFFTLYANADGYRAHGPHRRRRACSTATSWPRPATLVGASHRAHGRLRHRRRLRRGQSPSSTR